MSGTWGGRDAFVPPCPSEVNDLSTKIWTNLLKRSRAGGGQVLALRCLLLGLLQRRGLQLAASDPASDPEDAVQDLEELNLADIAHQTVRWVGGEMADFLTPDRASRPSKSLR